MATFDDKALAVARVYAQALLQVAQGRAQAAEVLEELQELAALSERDAAFRTFLESPLIESEGREKSLETIFRGKASDLLVDTLQVMNRKGRIGLLPAVAKAFEDAVADARGQVDVFVRSAVALTEAQRDAVRVAVQKKIGRAARLIEKVDASLIGGMVVQIGDRKVDASVSTRLRGLSEALLARGTRQILSGAHVRA
jgi:F-type H+-transporting ATPase subunit delta